MNSKNNETLNSHASDSKILKLGFVILGTVVTLASGIILILLTSYVPNYSSILSILGTSLVIAGITGGLAEIWLHTYAKDQVKKEVMKHVLAESHNTISELMRFGLAVWLRREDFSQFGFTTDYVASLYESNLMKEFNEPLVNQYDVTLEKLDWKDGSNLGLIKVKETITSEQINTWKQSGSVEVTQAPHRKFVNRNGVLRNIVYELYGDDLIRFSSNDEENEKTFIKEKVKVFITDMSGKSLIRDQVAIKLRYDSIREIGSSYSVDQVKHVLSQNTSFKGDEDMVYLLYSVRKATNTSVLHYVVCYFKPLSPQETIKLRIETYPIFQERDFYYFHVRTLTNGASITLLNFEKSNLNVHIEPYHLPHNLNKTTITDFSININQLILPNSGVFVSWEPNKIK